MEINLFDIANKFNLKGNALSIEPYGNGHINKTYLLKTSEETYILQQINSYVFKDVEMLMNNICLVTSYLKDINVNTMSVIKTKDNKAYYKENDDAYFRIYLFVKDTICIEKIDNISLVDKDAEAFGKLHKDLAKMDASKLGEIIPNFHNTPWRYSNYLDALNKDIKNRKKNATKEIQFVDSIKDKLSLVVNGLKDGSIRYMTTHNDPKINNVLFNKDGSINCVIDLDTIMPGSLLYDVGDSFRSLFTGENEDNKDTSLLKVDFDIFRHYVHSYLKEMKDSILDKELELIPYSAFLLTSECGIRFLEDYLKGDVYFHTKYDEHNLIRCRTQFALAKDILVNLEKMNAIVKEEMKKIRGE